MPAVLAIGGINVEVVKKDIKNLHPTVHPPRGDVRIAAPQRMQLDTIRLYAISKLPWLRRQLETIRAQEREPARDYVNRESHLVWGQRYLFKVVERDGPPTVELRRRDLVLQVRPGTDKARRQEILAAWYRDQVRTAALPLLAKWTRVLKVEAGAIFVRRMKTKWGSCNHNAKHIRLNTQLVTKPKDLLEYVIVHEMVHLIEPTHSERFLTILGEHYPTWREARAELNELPLAAETWRE